MIFFKHNLITFAFIVIAVWGLPDTSDLELLKKSCIGILSKCAKFENKMSDKNKRYLENLNMNDTKLKRYLIDIITAAKIQKTLLRIEENDDIEVDPKYIINYGYENIDYDIEVDPKYCDSKAIRNKIAINFAQNYIVYLHNNPNLRDPATNFCIQNIVETTNNEMLMNIFHVDVVKGRN